MENGTGILVLNDPVHKNKLGPDILNGIISAFEWLISQDAKAIVLTGSDGVFSAGYDIERVADDFSLDSDYSSSQMNILERALSFIGDCNLPTLAMIDGYCIGAAFEMACAFDFRIATEHSRFGITPAKIGLVYPLSGLKRVSDIVGNSFAREMFLTGRVYSSEKMHQKGFLNYISGDDIRSESLSFLEKVKENSSVSVSGMKKSFKELLSVNPDETFCRKLTEDSLNGDHIREGKKAFFEKRKPSFR